MNKIMKTGLVALTALSMAACGNGSAAATEAPAASEAPVATTETTMDIVEQIKANGKLVVGTEAQYAPFEFKDTNGDFAGCDIYLAQAIADELGVELEVMDMSFDGIIPAVKSGQVDIGIAAFTVTEERKQEIDFTDIYQRDEQMLVVAKGNEDVYTSKESLAGLQVGAQKGTIQSLLIQSALPDSTLFELEKYPALALEVANGNIAGLVVDGSVGEGLIAANDKLAQANFEFSAEEANFGKACVVAKGNDSLTEIANKVIKKVMDDGSFEKSYEDAVELAKTLGI